MGEVTKSAQSFARDEMIITEGEASDGKIFFLRKGQAAAEVGDKFVGTINQGEFFGEVAAILKTKRGASVRAIVACECDVFNGLRDDKLIRIMQREPKIGQRMLETLAKRLQETSADSVAQISGKETLLERYRKCISGAMYMLEKLTTVYKAVYLQELLDHLSQSSGIQLGNKKDADEMMFKQTTRIFKKD